METKYPHPKYGYLFAIWTLFVAIVAGLYLVFWDMIAGALYLKGYFSPSIYTTLFCFITVSLLLINGIVYYMQAIVVKTKNDCLIILWHILSFIAYFFLLIGLTNYYLANFLKPSVAFRETFSSYSYISIFFLAIISVIWIINFCKCTFNFRPSKSISLILILLTTLLFEFFWVFLDAVTSM